MPKARKENTPGGIMKCQKFTVCKYVGKRNCSDCDEMLAKEDNQPEKDIFACNSYPAICNNQSGHSNKFCGSVYIKCDDKVRL